MTSQIIMISGAMVCPSPWAASFVPSPLRQAARDAGRLGRLSNQQVTAFACHLPADKRSCTSGLAVAHCTMIVCMLGWLGACNASLSIATIGVAQEARPHVGTGRREEPW